MDHFTGQVAIVTGAASGIGRGICEVLLDRGAVVYAADIREDALAGLAFEAGELCKVSLDVTCEQDVADLVRRVVDERGRLDLIFNNAGIGVVGDFRQIHLDDVRRITDVNLWGVIYGTRAAYDVMAAQGHGHIVNIASSAGVMPVPMQSAYAMTKHAVVGLSRSLRIEAATYGVKVSAVLPGLVRTGFFDAATVAGEYDFKQEMEDVPVRPIPARRAGELILAGVRANRELIAFPTSNRIILWLFRHFPGLMTPALARTTTKSLSKE
jgi:NAD(P)-dependent dehydrogenase (short-subunit alcohol dehydrogenase family)